MSKAPWYGALVAIPFVAAAAASANDFIQRLEARVAASERTIVIENLAGDAQVLPASGAETQITATIHVAPGNDALARPDCPEHSPRIERRPGGRALSDEGRSARCRVAASRIPVRTPRTLAVASTSKPDRHPASACVSTCSCASLQTAT